MEDEAAVAEERAGALDQGHERVVVRGLEAVRGDLAPLAAQVAHLARLRLLGVARGFLPPQERVEVSECLGAVAVLGNGIDVKVVGWEFMLARVISNRNGRTGAGDPSVGNLLKGPPSLGRFSNLTLKVAPTPSGPVVAETEPLTLPSRLPVQKGFSGRVATKLTPSGLFSTRGALRGASWARTPEAPKAAIAKIFEACMVFV